MGFQFNPLSGQFDIAGSGAAQVNSDWNSTSGVSQILNKPSLSAVATSGSASDLSTGTLDDARLSSNVSLDNQNNSFTAGQTITAPANTSALTASYSVTGANTTPLLDLSGTWNTTGSANGIRLNINNVASSSGSNLLNLQLGGIPLFTVTRSGSVTTAGAFFAGNSASGLLGLTGMGSGITYTSQNTGHFPVAGGIIEQRSGTTAQTFRLFGTFTDASNGRRLDITSTTGGIFTLTATGNGTGASGNILKLTAPVLIPASSVTLATNGDLAFEATSNTSLTIRYRGSDGTTRSASLTLA